MLLGSHDSQGLVLGLSQGCSLHAGCIAERQLLLWRHESQGLKLSFHSGLHHPATTASSVCTVPIQWVV